MEGKKFSNWKVIKLDHIKEYINKKTNIKSNQEYYLCKCDCGKEKIVNKNSLISGKSQSCGCIDKVKNNRLYHIYYNIKARCYNKNLTQYKDWGGRGIKVCDEWLHDFQAFYDWSMANGYQDNLSIDRIDNDGNYEPLNCRWTSKKLQARNKNNNKIIIYNNKAYCISAWAEKMGIKCSTLFGRLKNNWSIEKALTTSVNKKKDNYGAN